MKNNFSWFYLHHVQDLLMRDSMFQCYIHRQVYALSETQNTWDDNNEVREKKLSTEKQKIFRLILAIISQS